MRIHKFSAVTAAAVILLFLALSAYIASAIYSGICRPYETETVHYVSIKDSIELNGIAIRREQLVCSPGISEKKFINGCRIPKGSVLALKADGSAEISPESSVYSDKCDGFEFLKPEDMLYMSPSELSALMKKKPDKGAANFGKLVLGWDWYFAAVCKADADLKKYSRCQLAFSGTDENLQGRIVFLSPPENGDVLIVIRLNSGGDDFVNLRKLSAELIFEDYSGLKLPVKALQRDSEGNEFVYTLTAGKPKKKAVEIIYKSGESCLAAEENSDDSLREGNVLILSGEIKDEGRFY